MHTATSTKPIHALHTLQHNRPDTTSHTYSLSYPYSYSLACGDSYTEKAQRTIAGGKFSIHHIDDTQAKASNTAKTEKHRFYSFIFNHLRDITIIVYFDKSFLLFS